MANYHQNGVTIDPAIPSAPSVAHVTYNGLLYQSGATEVYAHVGYGSMWQNTYDYKMAKTDHGFEAAIPIPQYSESLNVCFKDAASNWDNHAGVNYIFDIGSLSNNTMLEVAEEVGVWDGLRRSYKAAVDHLFGSSD